MPKKIIDIDLVFEGVEFDEREINHATGIYKNRLANSGKRNAMYGKKPAIAGKNHTKQTIEKMKLSQKKTWEDDEIKNKKIKAMNSTDAKIKKTNSLKQYWEDPNNYQKRCEINSQSRTKDVRNKISKKLKGVKKGEFTDSHKQALSDALKGIPKPKLTCPHCDKEGGGPIMKRYHFDNCKFK
jgi:hypothetical protein